VNAPATEVVRLITMTDVMGITHLLTDDAMIAGRPSGRYVAVCGDEVLAGSLTTPERDYCRPCRWRVGQ